MAIEDGGQDRGTSVGGGRHEQPQAPGDDFGSEAERLELRHGAIRISGELDAIGVHDERAANLKAAGDCRRSGGRKSSKPSRRIPKRRSWSLRANAKSAARPSAAWCARAARR